MVALFLVGVNSVFASTDPFEQRAQQKFNANRPTEVTVRIDKKNTTKTYKNNFVPIRFLFEKTSEQITWNNKTKTATVIKNGKRILFTTKDIKGSINQIVWPKGWLILKDGRTYIDMIYLNQIFDRYGNYETNSEESAWEQKLGFIGIAYIDSIYGGKNSTEHVFVMFDKED
ncbi:hypothetical protein FHS19_007014 [Paenibacillus rhizosphaerae]|uniref:Copper amine oxidase-like N-terminal domain-containing protein n=1 Tax=Paenibacillus rhizosphaerae TaxID=297318 RepID=A0A839TZI2_9BACL|nr:stalk domain-containing protein [Paenibacillus rhizosphaerae]MBB3132285.1 hypothetical protein [Paenibacillus rhizosphaerae]